jgi:hypothetical protein
MTPWLILGLLAAGPAAAADIVMTSSAFGTSGRIITDTESRLGLGFTAGLSVTGMANAPESYSEAIGFWRWRLPALIDVEAPAEHPPLVFEALPSFPNPFRQRTAIRLAIPTSAGAVAVRIDIYDVAGRLVRTLEHSVRGPGEHVFEWNGESRAGARAGDGIYFCHIQAGPFRAVQRLALVR